MLLLSAWKTPKKNWEFKYRLHLKIMEQEYTSERKYRNIRKYEINPGVVPIILGGISFHSGVSG